MILGTIAFTRQAFRQVFGYNSAYPNFAVGLKAIDVTTQTAVGDDASNFLGRTFFE